MVPLRLAVRTIPSPVYIFWAKSYSVTSCARIKFSIANSKMTRLSGEAMKRVTFTVLIILAAIGSWFGGVMTAPHT
jgi:hypothetical protein